MLLDEIIKNDFEEIYKKPILKESPRLFASSSIKPRSVVYAESTIYKYRKII
jgi:hypothetical protein